MAFLARIPAAAAACPEEGASALSSPKSQSALAGSFREHCLVVLPSFRGLGIGAELLRWGMVATPSVEEGSQ